MNLSEKKRKKLLFLLKGAPIEIVYFSGTNRHGENLRIGAGNGVTHFESFVHELGHLIEIPDHRILEFDFGMDNDPGPEGYNWKKALKRELKALAWEGVIFDYFKMKFPKHKSTIYKNCRDVLNLSATYNNEIKDKKSYFLCEVSRYQKKYSVKKFLKEWYRKIELLKKDLKK